MVFVVDSEKRPLAPCHPARARRLLMNGKAAIWRRYPCTIILKRAVADAQPTPLRIKIDPGSKTTGLAILNDATGQVVWAGELTHRGQQVKARLDQRRACRRSRRQRHTRYRPARFLNRRRHVMRQTQPLRFPQRGMLHCVHWRHSTQPVCLLHLGEQGMKERLARDA
jgi:hypothetical protein